MTFFDQIVAQLFPKKSGKNEILLHEPIKRSEAYLTEYKKWVLSFERIDLLNAIQKSYELKQEGIIGSPDVHVLTTKASNGFAISFEEQIGEKTFSFLFDWLGDKVKELSYKKANSDTTITAKNGIVETLSKHYFKPKIDLSNTENGINQQFGNILIEHISVDDKPSYIRFIVNNYNDRQYKKADQFEILADFLFSN